MKQLLKTLLTLAAVIGLSSAAQAQEAPDALVKRICLDVIESAKADKDIQAGNQKKVLDLVESKIIPYVDFQSMTSRAAGRSWRDATPEQQKQLTTEFRSLLVYTYSGAIAQIKDQKIDFKPLRADPADTEVEVRTQVIQTRGDPIQLNYRLEKNGNSWKIFDVNVLGAWLVETYKGNFAAEIGKGGMDGLIAALQDKNRKLAAKGAKGSKS